LKSAKKRLDLKNQKELLSKSLKSDVPF
jgi:hypothetical protein